GDGTAHRAEPGPPRGLRAETREPLAAAGDDVGHGGQGLDVVHHGRLAEGALDRRERGFELRPPLLSLERGNEPRLLAADVGAGAAVDDDAVLEPRAEDARSQEPVRFRRAHRLREDAPGLDVLAADVDEGRVAADCVGGDEHPLDQRVGIALEDVAVLEGPRLALVGVDDEIDRARAFLRDEAPFGGRREARAPEPAQVRLLDLGRDPHGPESERLPEGLVAAERAVAREGPRLRPREVPGEDRLGHRRLSSTRSMPGRSSGPTYASSTCIIGAASQGHRHSTPRNVTRPSGVGSPASNPSRSSRYATTSSAPRSEQVRLWQTEITWRPTGRRKNSV